MGIVEQYLLQLKNEKRRWRRAAAILTVLSFLVAAGVSWNLRMTGITIANGATCGKEEHWHTEDCPMEKVLICGYEEEAEAQTPTEAPTEAPAEVPTEAPTEVPTEAPTEAPAEAPEEEPTEVPAETEEKQDESTLDAIMNVAADVFSGFVLTADAAELPAEHQTDGAESGHSHTDECYAITWLCEMEEHIHVLSCYADTTADLESAVIWEADLPKLTGDWAEDLAQIARSQLGYGESERNYIVGDDTETKNGITRYGQWYGNPYGDWSGMFVMFCLNYSNIPQEAVPWSPGVYNMMRLAQDAEVFLQPDSDMKQSGNLLFLDTDANGNADKIVVVTAYTNENTIAIGGDWENKVAQITLSDSDTGIMGYVNIRQLQEAWKVREEAVPSDPTEPEATEPADETVPDDTADEPAISLDVEFPEEGILRLTAQIHNIEEALYAWQWQVSEDGNEPWTDIDGATELVCDLENTEENFNRVYRLQGRKVAVMFKLRAAEPGGDSSDVPEDDNTIISEPIAPFSIGKNNNTYTIDVYAIPVDADGNRITELALTELSSFSVRYNGGRVTVQNQFDTDLGAYQSAYFGTVTTVSVNNIDSVWCSRYYNWGYQYALAYRQTNGTENDRWLTSENANASLYLRYIPEFTVTFESEGFASISERVQYKDFPSETDPGTWSRDGYTLLGWTINGNEQNVYTFEELMKLPVTGNVTYTAKWVLEVTVSFNLGEYANELNPIDPMVIPYGSEISPLPTPIWKNNAVAMSFDGWYLDKELSRQITADHKFYENTILYAKWSPKDEGYYVYFMDFKREGQVPLVLVTYSVTEGHTVSPYIPGNAPAGTEWDGKWYLEEGCTNPYTFTIPVSDMTEYLTGANRRDLYLYPGAQAVCRAIFVTYGTKVDPITVLVGGSIDLDQYRPERTGYEFAGWTLKDGTPVSGVQQLDETTTYYAKWNADYVPFEAILRIENANDTGMTQADILGTWYAKAGSQIRVKSTYSGTGDSRKGTHEVVCVIDGVEFPVYKDAALGQKATLSDVYSTYFVYNNTGTTWTDEVNWDDVYTGGEVPYSTRPISSAGDTIINFDYMRVRNDIVFTIPNTSSGGYIDVYKLQQNGLITGSVIYSGTKPTATGQNVSATGVSSENISWSYTAATRVDSNYNNYYTLHNMKYGQRIYEVYPVGGSWLTARNAAYHQYAVGSGQYFSSRRQDLTSDFFSGSGRALSPYSLTVEFENQEYIALMYAVECLEGETPDFVLNGVGYKVDTELCEVVKHTGFFAIKDLEGCEPGINSNGTYSNNNKYYTANTIPNSQRNYAVAMSSAKIGNTSVYTLFNETYWPYYAKFNGVQNIKTFAKAYIFYYNRLHMNIQFNFGYDSDGDGMNETARYENIAYGERIAEYQFGSPDYEEHPLMNREGYEFAGWLDANGFVLEAEDWESIVATGDSENNTMIFIAKWEKISNNIVEYYEDRSSTEPFESHYFDDGELVQYPTMAVYPEGWVWQEYGEGQFQRFDWDVPMYGEYGVQETRIINGEERVVNVVRIYGTWDESHTKVVYDPNAPQGGIPGTAPTDTNEYTIWQSDVPVASRGETANADPDMVFVGWQLDRDGIVYHPGDHVPVRWPRTMIFTAQWAKEEDVVYLRYDPNGGTPMEIYPNDPGFPYRKNATAAVWDNTGADGTAWFSRVGYSFTGWNTEPDGTGTAYPPDSNIVLTAPVTTLYAQWEKMFYTLSVYKVDSESNKALNGAEFGLYRLENGRYLSVQSLTTGIDGHVAFLNLEADTLYKLVEEKPPNGYAIIAKEIFFALRPMENTVALQFYDAEGNVISAPNGASAAYITGNQLLTLTVKNLRGYELPSTGGTGTFFHILCGLFLVTAPLVYGISLRRKYERRSRE